MSWSFTESSRTILFGSDACKSLAGSLDHIGVQRPFLIASPRASRSEAARLLEQSLGRDLVGSFTGVREHAPVEDIDAITDQVKSAAADVVVAVGGGSSGDTAKAVAMRVAGSELALDFAAFAKPEAAAVAYMPLVSVPTTLAGAELTYGGAITENNVKRFFGAPGLASRVAVYDPEAIADVPRDVLLSTGMNGLAHCLEAVYARGRSPMSDMYALDGAARFTAGLVSLARDDRSVQNLEELQFAGILGGLAILNAGAAIHHSVCHVIGGQFNIPHGRANASVLPFALAFNEPNSRTEQRMVGTRVGEQLDAAGISHGPTLAEMVFALRDAIGLSDTLQDAGIDEASIGDIVEIVVAHEPGLEHNPTPVTSDSLRRLVEAAWSGNFVVDESAA